jgi:hypothetical protein
MEHAHTSVFSDDNINFLAENIWTVKKHSALLDASEEAGH